MVRVRKNHPKQFVEICHAFAKNVEPSLKDAVTDVATHPCELCGTCFTLSALPKHKFCVHGVDPQIRSHVATTHCIVCMHQFWSRYRLLHHLGARSSKCLNVYLAETESISDESRVGR